MQKKQMSHFISCIFVLCRAISISTTMRDEPCESMADGHTTLLTLTLEAA